MTASSLILPNSSKSKLLLIAGSAVFVLLFHIAFQPFQMRLYAWETKITVALTYTILTILVLLTSLFVIPQITPSIRTKVHSSRLMQLSWIGFNIALIGIGFFTFKVLAGFYELSWERAATGIVALISVGSIPVVGWLVARRIRKNTSTDQIQRTVISAQRGNKKIKLNEDEILYLEIQGNYVTIATKQSEFKLRGTLQFMRNQLNDSDHFCHCHRAYIVNIKNIVSIEKVQHNFSAILTNGQRIPLSRAKVDLLREMLS